MRSRPLSHTPRTALRLESLEQRDVPAIVIQIDYSHDATGFFRNNPAAQATLQQAANDLGARLSASLPAVVPGGGNVWSESFFDPSTGQQTSVANPAVGANTIVVYAGARVLGSDQVSVGGFGGYSATGSQAWQSALAARGPIGTLLWGGSVAFDTTTAWYFGSAGGPGPGQVDFLTCATHELGHVLGFGTAPTWYSQVHNGVFTGPNSEAVYGGAVPVTWGAGAELGDITVGGVRPTFNLTLPPGVRAAPCTPIDWATLADIGWSVAGVTGGVNGATVAAVAPPAVSTVAPFTPPALGTTGTVPVVLTGARDGTVQVFTLGADDTLVAAGGPMAPFPGFTGVIRAAVADFNGDGVADYAFATGAGVAAQVRVVDGKTGTALAGQTTVAGGFTGGVFLAAGDADRDGKAELAVSADAGGGPRVQVFRVQNGGLAAVADFIAFDSPDFRGGSRVAFGDVNRDGAADLIVGAGVGGGPRVSVYSGAALAGGQLARLVPDFFALSPDLRSGVNVAAGDFDGDGYADIAYSTGDSGGPRVRVVGGATLVSNPGADVAALPALADFYALDPNDRSGIRLAARTPAGSSRAVLIAASGSRTSAAVRAIPLDQMNTPRSAVQSPFADPVTVDGVGIG